MNKKWFVLLIICLSVPVYFLPTKPGEALGKSVIIDKIVVEKGKRRMYVYSGGNLVKTYRISLGKNPVGHKEFEGDCKTPEGNYIINDKNPYSSYHKNLGISYPNPKDMEAAKKAGKSPGSHIKIHGLKNGLGWIGKLHLLVDWTLGCIAVTNKEIDELYDAVKIGALIEILP